MNKKNNQTLILIAIFIATFMTSVEVTIVTTALPEIISALHGLAYQSWIMSSYLLTTAISTLIYGKLADTYGRKKLFQIGVILFTAGSCLSGFAPSIFFLIAARTIQGCGAGAIIPLTFTIIADLYSFKKRAQVLAFTNTAWGLSALIGPLLGGLLVDRLSWHWVFFVNVPLGILVWLLIVFFYTDHYQGHATTTLDTAGCFWLAASLTCLLVGIQLLTEQPLIAELIIILAIIFSILFFRHEKKVANPLLSLKIFKNKTFNIQIATATILSGILICYQIYFPIWLQSIYQIHATQAGLVVTSSSIAWLITSMLVGKLLERFPPRKIALTVIFIQAISYLPLLFISKSSAYWIFYLVAAVSGGGMGIVITMNIILCQQLVDPNLIASATSLVTLGRSLGQTVMAGVYGAVFNASLKNMLPLKWQTAADQVVSGSNLSLSLKAVTAIEAALLSALHTIFALVILLFAVALISNWFDPIRNKIS